MRRDKSPTGMSLQGPSQFNDAMFGVLSTPGVKRDRRYISPKPAGLLQRRKTGYSISRSPDGTRYMFVITTNAYQDREDETLTTKALKAYVDQAWETGKVAQPYLWWHDEDLPPIGDVIWADTEGPFLYEVVRERKSLFARKVWDYVEAHPEMKWGASHGFEYPENEKTPDGTYKAIHKFETSLLLLSAAANPYTLATVVGTRGNMNRDQVLDQILGTPGIAAKLRKGVRGVTQTLAQQGVQHKAAVPKQPQQKGLAEDVKAKLDELTTMLSDDPQLAAAIMDVLMDPGMADVGVEEMELDEGDVVDEELPAPAVAKGQPGYGEPDGGDDEAGSIATFAAPIIKRPGTFPTAKGQQAKAAKPQDPQVADLLRANKALNDNVKALFTEVQHIAAALGELSDVPERLERLENFKSMAPRTASTDSLTAITDPQQIKSAKDQLADYDNFWGGKVAK